MVNPLTIRMAKMIALARIVICSVLACGASACATHHAPQALAPAPPLAPASPTSARSCTITSVAQAKTGIDNAMQTIADLRNQAVGCTKQPGCPLGMQPFECSDIQSGYGAWLSYISQGLQNGSAQPPAPKPGNSSYEDAVNSAWGIYHFVKSCNDPFAALEQHSQQAQQGPSKPSADCGPDVDCQRAELQKQILAGACAKDPNYSSNCPPAPVSPFVGIGNNILTAFQSCNQSVRQAASNYLVSNYGW